MPQAVTCRPVTAEVWVRQRDSLRRIYGGQVFRRVLQRSFVSVIQPVLCAHSVLRLSGQKCEGGKLKQSSTVPDIRKGRELEEKVLRHCSRTPRRLEQKYTDFERTYSTNTAPQLIRKLVCGLFYPLSIVIIYFPTVYNFSCRDTQYTLHTKLNFTSVDSFG